MDQTITLKTLNLDAAERELCLAALRQSTTLPGAADLLGITRHGLRRRMVKHGIDWDRATRKKPGGLRTPT